MPCPGCDVAPPAALLLPLPAFPAVLSGIASGAAAAGFLCAAVAVFVALGKGRSNNRRWFLNAGPDEPPVRARLQLDGKWEKWDEFCHARAPFLDVHEQHKKM